MISQEDLLAEAVEKVSQEVADSLRDTIMNTVQAEVTRALTTTLTESDFYKKINDDMRQGLREIYKEIKNAKNDTRIAPQHEHDPDELLSKASNQLDEVLRTTEKATVEIIDTIEKLQQMQSAVSDIVKSLESGGVTKKARLELKEINDTLGNDLLEIMTTLSFQDLTGQRIKIIIDTIKKIEQIVLDVYMTTGLKRKAKEEEPEKDHETIEKEAEQQAEKVVSKLQGPSATASDQGDVDDLLASLGL
ncbi:MAG: protein phosphatase CheZ [Desulfovibrio sp.]